MRGEKIGRQERRVRKALGSLIATVREFQDAMDGEMVQIELLIGRDAGRRVAQLMNRLTRCSDLALYAGGLGFDFRKDSPKAGRKQIMAVASRMYREGL